jgi:hypothetical protein
MAEFTRTRAVILTRATALAACTLSGCESGPVARAIVSSSVFVLEGQGILLGDRFHLCAKAVITRGHGIASGKTRDTRFPGGTLAMQAPFFQDLGLDLSVFFPGTLNLSVHPCSYRLGAPVHSFPQVKWAESFPPENFSFYRCRVRLLGEVDFVEALVYWPHPSTKPGFHQDPHVLEVLAPRIPLADYGKEMEICADSGSLGFFFPEG